MDKKQLLNTIEQIDYKILEHISNDEFDIEPTQIPDYLLTARRVLIERVRDIESKEKEDNENEIFNKIRNNVAEHYINQII